MSILDRLSNLDRRWIFLLVALSVALPLMTTFELPTKVSEPVQRFFNAIEELPAGSTVLISSDYDPASGAELIPMHKAVIEHCCRKGHRIITMGLWPGSMPLTVDFLETIAQGQYSRKYGQDFVHLGYMSGNLIVIRAIGTSFEDTFKTEKFNNEAISAVPLMRGVRNATNVDLVVSISAGFPGLPEWVQVIVDTYNVKLVGGCTAVSAPQIYPYFPRQLSGLLGGLKGAAEYEFLLDLKGDASKGMTAQSFAHLLIMLLIVVGNATYFLQRYLKP